jgi:hypothetical protein
MCTVLLGAEILRFARLTRVSETQPVIAMTLNLALYNNDNNINNCNITRLRIYSLRVNLLRTNAAVNIIILYVLPIIIIIILDSYYYKAIGTTAEYVRVIS